MMLMTLRSQTVLTRSLLDGKMPLHENRTRPMAPCKRCCATRMHEKPTTPDDSSGLVWTQYRYNTQQCNYTFFQQHVKSGQSRGSVSRLQTATFAEIQLQTVGVLFQDDRLDLMSSFLHLKSCKDTKCNRYIPEYTLWAYRSSKNQSNSLPEMSTCCKVDIQFTVL